MKPTDEGVRALARTQGWLITRAQLLALGWTDERTERRLARGDWRVVQAGVYFVLAAEPTWMQLARAACMSVSGIAAISYRAALRVHGLVLPSAPLEMTVAYGHGSLAAGVITHRSRRLEPEDLTTVDGVPVTSVRRSIVDAAAYLDRRTTWKALERADRRGLITASSMADYARRHRARPGSRLVRSILDGRTEGRAAGSGAETSVLVALDAMGVRAPIRQHRVVLPDGSEAVLDLCWMPERFALEIDGPEHDATSRAYDARRDRALLALGYRVAHFPADEASDHAVRVALEVRRLLDAAA